MDAAGPDRRSASTYRALLRAYPRAFREDVGADMAAMFADLHRKAREEGRLAVARLWIRTVADTLRNAVPERVEDLRLSSIRPRRRGETMETLRQDLRQALRGMRERPGFAFVAILTLALGVGANAAIFSLTRAMILRPLPYRDAQRLVMVWTRTGTSPDNNAASWPEFLDWRAASHTLEDMAVWRGQSVNLTATGEPDRLVGAFVTANFFDIVGARAQLGRTFLSGETDPSSTRPVAVLSHGVWTRRFGADPSVLGRTVTLNGTSHTVVGVLGPDFAPGKAPFDGWFMATEVFLPVSYFPNSRGLERGQSELLVVGRLRDGATPEQAQAELAVVARGLERAYPDTHAGRTVAVVPLHDEIVGSARPPLLVLLGAVALVLLIACANVANLMLARAAQRQREMAMRQALGAGRGRLVRQLLTESVVLASMAGVAGLALGWAGLRGLLAVLPAGTGVPADVGIDGGVLAFTAAVALSTALVFGLVPALQASRPDLEAILRESSRGSGAGLGRRRVRDVLIVSEVALSLMLLVGAGLLLRTVLALRQADPGFRTDHLITMEFRLPPARYKEPPQIAAFFRNALERMRAVRGVESVALVRAVPFSGNGGGGAYSVFGRPEPEKGREPQTQTNIVSPDYFRTMGIPILHGRTFDDHDTADAPAVAVVSATFARRAWPGEDALGKRFRIKGQDRWLSVVGVTGDIRHSALAEPPAAQAYTPHDQDARIFACVVARATGDALALGQPLREAIWSVDKDQPVWKVRTMEQLLESQRGPARALTILVAVFAGLAVALAAVGLYGVLSYAVAQRTREIGIRMALGAPASEVVRMVVGRGMGLTVVAVALGLGGAAALSRLLARLLFGVGPFDPATFVGAAVLLSSVALIASYLPARRASRVDPVIALAEE